jgi:alpha-L-fucosidase
MIQTKIITIPILVLLLSAGGCIRDNGAASGERFRYEPTRESLSQWEVPQWFQDAVLGVYVHWGPYSVPGFVFKDSSERVDSGIWYGGEMYNPDGKQGVYEFHVKTYGDPHEFGYHDLIALFTAEHWDPDGWAGLFKYAGCDYAGICAEHGDGFPMWDTEFDEFNALNMGPQRDILGEMFESARKLGMKTVATIHEHPGSNFGWAVENAPEGSHLIDPAYAQLYNADSPEVYIRKVYELIDRYQPDQLWLDNPILSSDEERWFTFVSDYYNKGLEWGRGGVFIAQKGTSQEILEHTVLDIEGGEFPGGIWRWAGMTEPQKQRWQKDVPIGNYWAYAEGVGCRPVNMLVDGIVDRISKNGVTFLDLAPRGDGTLPEAQIEGMRELGDWMTHNKEALYAARPAPFKDGGVDAWQAKGGTVRFTEKGDFVYAIDLGNQWPPTVGFAEYEESTPPTAPYTLPGVQPVAGSAIRMLGSSKQLSWRQEGENLVIEELPDPLPCEHAWTFKIRVHE